MTTPIPPAQQGQTEYVAPATGLFACPTCGLQFTCDVATGPQTPCTCQQSLLVAVPEAPAAAPTPAPPATTATTEEAKGIQCPHCKKYPKWSCKETQYLEGYFRRKRECGECEGRIYAVECFQEIAPPKGKRKAKA